MSDYTPTTDDIRTHWIADEDVPAFDRWLASVKAEAWDEGWEANEAESDPWMHGKRTDGNPYRSDCADV